MENLAATPASNAKKLIIHCYVKRDNDGLFKLYFQTGNALPVFHSNHDSRIDAEKVAVSLGAVNCRLV